MGRLFYLDNLRSFALLLGIVFHSAIVYAPKIGYAIQNPERMEPFGFFCYWIHSFRMPLFFLISGFFSSMVWEKKGWMHFLEGRFKRILIPLIFGLLVFAPIQYYLMKLIKLPELGFFQFYPEFFTEEEFAQSHIWFLVDLFLFSLIFSFIPKKVFSFFFEKGDGRFDWRWIFPFFLFCFSLTIAAHSFYPRGDDFFGINKLTFFYQLGFYFCGVFAYYSGNIFSLAEKIDLISIFHWLLLGLIVFVLFYHLDTTDPLWMPYQYGNYLQRMAHLALWCLSPLIWCRFFVMVFQKWGNETGETSKYLIESSLPIYLLHHPISLFIAFHFKNWEVGAGYKFLIHTFLVFFFSFLIYDLIVRNSEILKRLFGLKS
ncbi:acyltransferase family protein [Leptospira idonii]|uniref:Acyltransferase n=1 Tax=Leptospira idonii TaxID=1193500 RepID=A0A4R9M3A0_9LEPT|nr:acyltransferase family protein [Leptospira idonii]TGN20602.1 acyltransferase [Leptospira idonii]